TEAPAGLNIGEVIEKTMHFGHAVQVPLERRAHALDNLRVRQKAAMVGDAQGGEAEARRGDAGHAARIAGAVEIIERAIENLAGVRATLLPEEHASLKLQLVQKRVVFTAGLPDAAGKGRPIRHECAAR